MSWRFDQGRLKYFQLAEVRRLAEGLVHLDGVTKPNGDDKDIVRTVMTSVSTQPFLPSSYFVWRNYGRVFECLLLATVKSNHIIATDLCKQMVSTKDFDGDDYLAYFSTNFYYPSPIFEQYDPAAKQIWPAVAVMKFLFSEYLCRGKDHITVNEIGEYLISNGVTGDEPLSHYSSLPKKSIGSMDLRQTRELVKFLSQFSFLKWENPSLFLEVKNRNEIYEIEKLLQPMKNPRKKDAAEEILQMGGGAIGTAVGTVTIEKIESTEEEFTEGKKIRVAHLRTERSAKLKQLYFKKIANPQICRMCDCNTVTRYPWTDHVIEVHHLLPLSSPVRVEQKSTSVSDLVGLCPSCHRATHRYYSKWLKNSKTQDFADQHQAIQVFNEAKSKIVLI